MKRGSKRGAKATTRELSDEMPAFSYAGSELDLFAKAVAWKAYWATALRPYIGERVLDVGAGLGATARLLNHFPCRHWLALEPDPHHVCRMQAELAAGRMGGSCETRVGTLEALAADESFDTVLYIDVLEHIESDRDEIARAAAHLNPGGYLVALAPSHNWLYSPFDQAIGHFRRYDSASLQALTPRSLEPERFFYLDSVGMLASLANRLFLKQAQPSAAQIGFWDKAMVPMSRVFDPLTGYRVGKSIVGVWRAPSR